MRTFERRKPYWVVWNPTGGPPRVRHYTHTSALQEAERLAKANPGQEFVVLQALHARRATAMHVVDFDLDPPF